MKKGKQEIILEWLIEKTLFELTTTTVELFKEIRRREAVDN